MKQNASTLLLSKTFFAAVLVGLGGCQHSLENPHQTREPAGTLEINQNLELAIADFHEYLTANKLSINNCSRILTAIYTKLSLSSPDTFTKTAMIKNGRYLPRDIWEARLELRNKLKELKKNSPITYECEIAIRNLNRAGRFMEDYLAYTWWKANPQGTQKNPTVLKGPLPHLIINPTPGLATFDSDSRLKLLPGDVLLIRGNSFVSAAIARMGDVDGQFSHLAIVHEDEKNNQVVVESLIETGLTITPIDHYFQSQTLERMVVFRHPDRDLAKRAADFIFRSAKFRQDAGTRFAYDFKMDGTDHTKVFCSEAVGWAYEHASGKKLQLPTFPSKFSPRNRSFFDKLGIASDQAFAPIDIELETDFDLVAEWRNSPLMYSSYAKDAILTKIYDWIEQYGYEFQHDKTLEGSLARSAPSVRRWPLLGELISSKVSLDITPDAIEAIVLMHLTGSKLLAKVEELQKKQDLRSSYPYTFPILLGHLEILRKQELQQYKIHKKWPKGSFHKYFQPKNLD